MKRYHAVATGDHFACSSPTPVQVMEEVRGGQQETLAGCMVLSQHSSRLASGLKLPSDPPFAFPSTPTAAQFPILKWMVNNGPASTHP